jgi:hypothetical protein
MKSSRKLSRRSFLTRVAGGAVAAGGAMVALTGSAGAQSGVTDADQGPNADPPNGGRGRNHIRGCTDSDRGPNADQAGNGRGNRRSDSDSGPNSDPANCARH